MNALKGKGMHTYDIIIAGGGVAGLSLAYHLVHSSWRDRSILIVDRAAKTRNDRTLSFWSAGPTPFDAIIYRSWDQLAVQGHDFYTDARLKGYRYHTIRGIDFYRFVQQTLADIPNVTFRQGTVEAIENTPGGAAVRVNGETFYATWVFDSLFNLSAFKPAPARTCTLQQHFRGWEIETAGDAFDPQTVTLMDFRTPQQDEARFCYVLPYTARRALVEVVTLSPANAERALRRYIERDLGLSDYRVIAREGGATPLTDWAFPRQTAPHVMTIGTQGGRVKPSSGYAFTRIQQDSAAIVRSLETHGHPFDVPRDGRFFRLCDALLLRLMEHRAAWMTSLFMAMFVRNPFERMLGFLDETTSPWDNLRLTASLVPTLLRQAFALGARRPNTPQTRLPHTIETWT